MKYAIQIILFSIVVGSASACENAKSLLNLSIECQNAHAEFKFLGKDVRADPESIDLVRKKITRQLDKLV